MTTTQPADVRGLSEERLATFHIEREEIGRITLCGSTKFRDEFELWNKRLTLAGFLVYSVCGFGHSGDTFTDEEKARLDQIHLAKIDASHAIVVVSRDGYIGASTRREIEHAKATGKRVYYTESFKHDGPGVYSLRTGPDGPSSLRYRAFDFDAARASHPAPAVGGEVGELDIAALEKVAREVPTWASAPWETGEDVATGAFEVLTQQDGDVDGDTGRHIVVGGDLVALMADALGDFDLATFIATFDPPTVLRLLAELQRLAAEVEELRANPIALDKLPFWPWLWADPFMDAPGTEAGEEATERRVRQNYEIARAPVPDQYAILHRADIQRLVHALWRKRALKGLLERQNDKLAAAEARAAKAEEERDAAEAQLTEARSQVERMRETAVWLFRAFVSGVASKDVSERRMSKERAAQWEASTVESFAKTLSDAAMYAEAGGEKTTGQENDNG